MKSFLGHRARTIALTVSAFAMCALASFVPLFADEGILIPREVYVGDTAEFSFSSGAFASVLEDGTLFALPPNEIPASDAVDVKSILVSQHGQTASVTIRFVPWASGVIRLPSFKLKGVAVTPPVVRIGSLIEKTGKTAIEPPRSPLLVPGTTWILYGLIAAILVATVAGIVVAVRLARYLLQSPLRRQAGRRAAILFRELKNLERKAGKISFDSWYAAFALSVRRYFGAYCDGDFGALLSSTGTEISSRVRDLDASLASSVASLFSAMDEIRFGSAVAPESVSGWTELMSARVSADLDTVRAIVAGLEASASAREAAVREVAARESAAHESPQKKEDSHARV